MITDENTSSESDLPLFIGEVIFHQPPEDVWACGEGQAVKQEGDRHIGQLGLFGLQ